MQTTSFIEESKENMEVMYIYINQNRIELNLESNAATIELKSRLKEEDILFSVRDYGGFEKVGSLGFSLPTKNEEIDTTCGDVVLYQGNQIVIFYGENSWSYTKIGRIEGYNTSQMKELLGSGTQEVRLSLS